MQNARAEIYHINMRSMIIQCVVLILLVLLLTNLAYAQDILYDDLTDVHDVEDWSNQLDTLRAYGVTVHFTSDEEWVNIMDMDMLWIQSPCNECSYSISEKRLFQEFVRSGGKILIGSTNAACANDSVINDLLEDEGWQTTMEIHRIYSSFLPYDPCSLFYEFPPFTDGVNKVLRLAPWRIVCGDCAFPFAFLGDDCDTPVTAISYPFLHEDNCSSFVILVTGNHTWEDGHEIMDDIADTWIFARNILLTAAGTPGYELEPGAIPGGGNACEQMPEEYHCLRVPNPVLS